MRIPAVIHIEDDPLWLEFVATAIRRWDSSKYLGGVGTGRQGIALAAANIPDIVLIDWRLPDTCGLHVIEQLHIKINSLRFIVLTCCMNDVLLHCFATGMIHGIIWKTLKSDDLKNALLTVADGKTYISNQGAAAIARFRASPISFPKILTIKECTLIRDFAIGFSDSEVAATVGLSVSTVHQHRQNIMSKLSIHTAQQLTLWAINKGFLILKETPPADN